MFEPFSKINKSRETDRERQRERDRQTDRQRVRVARCVCVCVCVRAGARVCVESDEKDVEGSVVVCLYIFSRLRCALGCVYTSVLLTLMFLYCVLRAHVG